MAINSQDDLIAALGAGQTQITSFNKNVHGVTAQAAGTWYDLTKGAGNPTWDAILGTGTNLTFTAVDDKTTQLATSAATGGNVATTTFTDTTHGTGRFTVGMLLTGGGITANTYITALGTGTGANNGGTYTISPSQATITNANVSGLATPNFIQHGGDVSPATKYLLNASIYSASATSAPAIFQLVDILGFVPVTTVTSTSYQTLLGSGISLPRYPDGAGVMAFISPLVVMGAGTPTIQLTYTNTSGIVHSTPPVPALPTANATAPVGQIVYSGTGAGKYGPFVPLYAGDTGIKALNGIQLSATMTSGVLTIVLCKPIGLPLPITTLGVPAERDYFNQLPSMPIIKDGACLAWLMYAGANTPTNTPYYGTIQTVWK